MGMGGNAVAAFKNTILQYHHQEKKDYGKDHTRTLLELASYSPPIGGKLKQMYSGLRTLDWNEDEISEMGLSLDNPGNLAIANIVEAATNIPIARVVQKIDNLREASDSRNQYWQRIALAMGWSKWDVGAENEELEAVKDSVKKQKKYPDMSDEDIVVFEKEKEIKALNKTQQEYILRNEGYSIPDLKNKKEADRIKIIMELYEVDDKRINDLIENMPSVEDIIKINKKRKRLIEGRYRYQYMN